MPSDFVDRFCESKAAVPQSLQLLFRDPLRLEAGLLSHLLSKMTGLEAVRVELIAVADDPVAGTLVSPTGPQASVVGLIEWGPHRVKLAGFDAPMPYGPVEVCVGPAMIPPPLKHDAKYHAAHVLLYDAGTEPDAMERYVALGAVASVLAQFDAIVVMHEEARTAIQAIDLIPEDGEDILQTLRTLPIPLLWGGFVKMDAGTPDRPWVRSFANHRLGLPDLAYHLADHGETARIFQVFSGMLGYARDLKETFTAGDTVDLGDGTQYRFRAPVEEEWFLESDETMLVFEKLAE